MKIQIRLILAAIILSTINHQFSTARAQNTVFTYQGRVTDNGTNFNGSGQFQFALVTGTNFSSQATATVTVDSVNEQMTAITVINGGSGYTTAPTLMFYGTIASFPSYSVTLTNGAVASITVTSGGAGVVGNITVVVAPPPLPANTYTYWSNDGTSVKGGEPATNVNVTVNNGLFTVVLGDTTIPNMAAIDSSVFTQPDLKLRIWFNDGVNGFAALSPVQNLTPTPYAVDAMSANTASNLSGTVSASQLSGSISANQLNGTISAAQLPSTVLTNGTSGVNISGTFSGNGSGLTNINNASQIANVALLAGGNDFTGNQTVNGNVGIGTDDPSAPLHVAGSTTVALFDSSSIAGTWLDLNNSGGGTNWEMISTGSGNDEGAGKLLFIAAPYFGSGGAEPLVLGANSATINGNAVINGTVTVNGTFYSYSDRNAKQDFTTITPTEILNKVAQLPLSEWSYKAEANARHIGPMAQDFYSTFDVGVDDKHIAPIDEGGVALAAIQGLNQKVEEKDAEIQKLEQQNDSLAKQLNELETVVKSLAAKE